MAYIAIPAVQELDGMFLLDTKHTGTEGKLGVYILPGANGKFSLIETGPASTLTTIKEGISEAGFKLSNLEAILVTHIHLDHAGAAGALAAETGASVYVHERGAKHMHDPSRLMESATRIYGDMMDFLWGSMTAIPEEQLKVIEGGETLSILGHKLQVIYTPGHASHHVSYLLNNDALFTGDSAAIRLTGADVIRPALPPPDIHLEIWQDSIEKMLAAKPKRLMLTHFGETQDVEAHLKAVPKRNQAWADELLSGMQEKEETEDLVRRIASYGNAELVAENAPPEVMQRHQETSNYDMTVAGVVRYWTKYHPELLETKD